MEESKIETKTEGVITIHKGGEVIGIIYNDQNTRAKRLYWLKEMSVEEIAGVLTGDLSTVA